MLGHNVQNRCQTCIDLAMYDTKLLYILPPSQIVPCWLGLGLDDGAQMSALLQCVLAGQCAEDLLELIDTHSQGYTDLQSLVKCLDHRQNRSVC